MSSHRPRRLFLLMATLLASSTAVFAAPKSANVISLTGKGDVRQTDTSDWKPARVQQDLFHGDFVRTGDVSQMAILFTNQTQIRLNQNSQLQIKSLADAAGDGQTAVKLNAGRAWSQIKPQAAAPGAPPRLSMETPSATMSIRGTDWEVEVGPDGKTQLVVLSGVVDMGNEFGRITVGRNEAAVAEIGKAPVKIVLTRPKERVQWVTTYRPEPARYLAAAEVSLREDPALKQATKEMSEGRYAEARSQLVTAKPSWVRELMLADIKVLEGDLAGAIQLSRSAAGVSPSPSFAQAHLAGLLLMADEATEAKRVIGTALASDARSTEAWLAEGRRARFEGEVRRTEEAYSRATELAPKDERGWVGLGSTATEREQVAPARARLERAREINPRDPEAFGELGTLETFADRYPEAEAAFAAALKLRPDDYVALTGQGVMKLKQGRTDEALEDFLKAGLMEPRYARVRLYTGIAYYQLGRFDRAQEEFDKAAELDPKDPLPHLFASMARTDHYDMAGAVASARAALERMPNLKSLNQVANNQKGVANVGNALAFWGLKDWAMSYAQNGDYPFWGGSHLFLADLYESRYAKNSELFQGFTADPTVFGASNRFQSLIHRPGHYQALTLTYGQDDQIAEIVPRITLNGYSNSVTPFAYFLEVDQQRGDTRSGQDFSYHDRTDSVTAALGWVPRHDLRFFMFYNHDESTSRYASANIPSLDFKLPTSEISLGGSWFITPTAMIQARAGRNEIDGRQVWQQDERFCLGGPRILGVQFSCRFDDQEISRDMQLAGRWRLGDRGQWELAAGLEAARSPESSLLVGTLPGITLPPALLPIQEDASTISERSNVGYLGGRYFFSPNFFAQLDLAWTDYLKHLEGYWTQLGTVNTVDRSGQPINREFKVRKLAPRVGLAGSPAPGHMLRYAYQDWVKPSSPGGLTPVATAGIVLDETFLRFGGEQKRHVAKWEVEWSPRIFTEVVLDSKRAENLNTYDLTLAENFANLARIRQKTLTEITDFYAGSANIETSNAYMAGKARADQIKLGVSAIFTSSLSGTFSYTHTDSQMTVYDIPNGDRFYLPKDTVKLGATWVGPNRVRLSFDAQWRSEAWTLLDLTAPRDAYWNGAAAVSWESADKRVGVAAFAKELFTPHESAFYGVAGSLKF
jgi:tetratricopeptide (TPR) repeat protein